MGFFKYTRESFEREFGEIVYPKSHFSEKKDS
jgi:hypothetical protein